MLSESKHSRNLTATYYSDKNHNNNNIKSTQTAQTSASAKIQPKVVRDSNADFRINPDPQSRCMSDLSQNVVDALSCWLQSFRQIWPLIVSSSSHMGFMSHNWSATKQRLHPQSVAEISRHSVLSGTGFDNVRHCMRNANKCPKILYFAVAKKMKKWSGIHTEIRNPHGDPDHHHKLIIKQICKARNVGSWETNLRRGSLLAPSLVDVHFRLRKLSHPQNYRQNDHITSVLLTTMVIVIFWLFMCVVVCVTVADVAKKAFNMSVWGLVRTLPSADSVCSSVDQYRWTNLISPVNIMLNEVYCFTWTNRWSFLYVFLHKSTNSCMLYFLIPLVHKVHKVHKSVWNTKYETSWIIINYTLPRCCTVHCFDAGAKPWQFLSNHFLVFILTYFLI